MKIMILLSLFICIEMSLQSNLLHTRKLRTLSRTDVCIESPFEIYRRGDTWLRIHRNKIQQCKCKRNAICYDVRTKECSTNKCLNGGSCAQYVYSKDYICHCPEGYLGKHCEIDNKSNCINDNGKDYRGTRDYTLSGKECLQWDSFAVLQRKYNAQRSNALKLGLGSHNYCRNPGHAKKPWCYVQGSMYREYCDISKCEKVESKCGQREYKMNKIVGGNEAAIESHPWQAALYITDSRSKSSYFQCGGSLIHPCWVLTAAHCINPTISHSWYYVTLGKSSTNKPSKNEQTFAVEKIISHENFNDDTFDNDIALLKLKSQSGTCAIESKFVHAICLPSKRLIFSENTQCEVSGYGREAEFSPFYSKFLKEARVNLISQQKCRSPEYYGKKLTENMLCAAHHNWKEDACKGDSGGPLVCENNGRMNLYGITSWGDGCARPNKPGVYTRVLNYIQWIEENMI